MYYWQYERTSLQWMDIIGYLGTVKYCTVFASALDSIIIVTLLIIIFIITYPLTFITKLHVYSSFQFFSHCFILHCLLCCFGFDLYYCFVQCMHYSATIVQLYNLNASL
eukprot:415129_1